MDLLQAQRFDDPLAGKPPAVEEGPDGTEHHHPPPEPRYPLVQHRAQCHTGDGCRAAKGPGLRWSTRPDSGRAT